MMRSRYGEASDTAEDDSTTQQQPGAQPHQPQPARSSPSTNSRLNKNDFRLICANERLYEAYSELHCLAQDFEKPFDSPAILVVGHQTDGKSALVEALMGFQFNHVGGGTKTRRPITLHMKYNSSAVQPTCFLLTEDCGEQEVSLEELQEYIHNENQRLEEEQQFWSKEIVVKIEYKFCPNLTIIDTPGLISAAPGKKNSALQVAARQVEAMVTQKMAQQEYIILCLEDSSDWNNATTRRTVMQVDPTLSRTVLVSTKLDTRIPQFSTPSDVEAFLHAPGLTNDLTMLGGTPFFTSVPSGRVGLARESTFSSNDQFREAVMSREMQDIQELESKMQRKLDQTELSRLGVHQLRRFLEALLQRRYMDNVPAIVPLLEREHRVAESRLDASRKELDDLASDKLKDKGRMFREAFLNKLSLLLRGTVAAPADRFGETLADEHMMGGAFTAGEGKPLVSPHDLPNCNMRLYGGAQFHRAMTEFRLGVGGMACPTVTREEIVNACGLDDIHDGVNYVRTACIIAVSKSKDIFEPLIHQLGCRLAHVLRRILPISLYLLQKDGRCLAGHDLFLKRVGKAYSKFIEEVEGSCKHRCLEDLTSTTRFVTWSLHTKSHKALKSMMGKLQLTDPTRAAGSSTKSGHQQHADGSGAAGVMIDMLECTLWQRQLASLPEETVGALVAQIFEGIRDFIVQSVELKFNCFFLMPLIDTFPQHLREQLEGAWEEDIEGVFDVKAVRRALEARVKALEAEKQQVERLQHKFSLIHSTLAQQATLQAAPAGVKQSDLTERLSLMSLSDSASLCNLGKVRLPSSGTSSGGADRDARGPRDKNGGSGGGAPGAPFSSTSSSGPVKQLPPAPAGSLVAAAAAAAAAGSNGSLRSLGQQAVTTQAAGGKGISRGDASLMGGEGALTKGVKAHAVMLSQSALSVSNM